LWECQREQQPRGPDRDQQPCKPSRYREQHAFRKGLRDNLRARRADRKPHGRLRPALDRAGQQKIRDIRACND
jgi:hypothetical protein